MLIRRGGGEHMQSTRRSVLAALIKHSGCGAYCVAESNALIAGRKSMTERPHALLTDVWRCAQVIKMLLPLLSLSSSPPVYNTLPTVVKYMLPTPPPVPPLLFVVMILPVLSGPLWHYFSSFLPT